jgi:hypothetical protein
MNFSKINATAPDVLDMFFPERSLFFFYQKLSFSTIFFFNYWGRRKSLFIDNSKFEFFENLYFYRFSYIESIYYIFKKRIGYKHELRTISLLLYFDVQYNFSFLLPYRFFDILPDDFMTQLIGHPHEYFLRKKKKKVIYRSIPKSKILKNFRANIFLNFFKFFDTKKQINYNFIYHFFFNDFLRDSSSERVFLFIISSLKNLLLKFNSNTTLLLLFIIIYNYVFKQTCNIHFFSFFLKIFNFQLKETKVCNFLPFVVQLTTESFDFSGINIQFFGYERFIKSHLTTNFFKNKMFSIEQGFNKNCSNFYDNYVYFTNRNFFYFFEKYFKPKKSLYRQAFFIKKRLVCESLKNFTFSDRRFFMFNFLNILKKDSSYYSI